MARNVALIPAKGTSTRFPGKNMALFKGTPLFVHAVDIATKSGLFDYIVVSSDDAEILGTAVTVGAEAMPRPAELARDPAEVIEVSGHVLDVFRNNSYKLDEICILLPTSPLRTVQDLRTSYELLMREECQAVMSVVPFTDHKLFALEHDRHDRMVYPVSVGTLGPNPTGLWQHDGAVLWANANALRRQHGNYYALKIAPYFIDQDRALEIHTAEDLEAAERLAR